MLGIWGVLLVPVILAAFAAMVRLYAMRVRTRPTAQGTPKVDGVYWLCMALAGIVGTLLGDFGSVAFGFLSYLVAHLTGAASGAFDFSWMQSGHVVSTLVFGGAVAWMMARNSFVDLAKPWKYWTLLALIRTAGTAAGDYLVHAGLGLAGSSVLTGLAFAGLVLGFYVVRTGNLAALPQQG